MNKKPSKARYTHFTEEQKRRANDTDLEQFLPRHGYPLKPSGKEWRLIADPSITVYQNKWFDHSTQKGGNPISLIQFLFSMSWANAVTLLTGERGTAFETKPNQRKKKLFHLPTRSPSTKRLREYLEGERNIAPFLIDHFLSEDTLYADLKGNAVFVGLDKNGVPQLATLRNLLNQGSAHSLSAGSNRDYGFCHRGTSSKLYLFESPIDLLSHLTLYPTNWEEHSYLSLSGVSSKAVLRFLKDTATISDIVICLDNDRAGQRATLQTQLSILDAFPKKTYRITVHKPAQKDFNEDLQHYCTLNHGNSDTNEIISHVT